MVYNMMGQEIRRLVDEKKEAGYYETVWNGRMDSGQDASSGLYLIRMEDEGHLKTRKIMRMK
jgi:flagellar hook assembly protein FlgD